MRHTKLHRSRDTDEERALLRSGHLEFGMHHVHTTGGETTIRDINSQRHLQTDQAVWIQVIWQILLNINIRALSWLSSSSWGIRMGKPRLPMCTLPVLSNSDGKHLEKTSWYSVMPSSSPSIFYDLGFLLSLKMSTKPVDNSCVVSCNSFYTKNLLISGTGSADSAACFNDFRAKMIGNKFNNIVWNNNVYFVIK